jgi:hypothetical protein
MKATLYKLKEGYVLCSDERLTLQELCYGVDVNNDWTYTVHQAGSHDLAHNHPKVLTQSPDFSLLSEEYAKRIGWFDYSAFSNSVTNQVEDVHIKALLVAAMRVTYLKALELTDRRFTEEDMREAIAEAWNSCEDNEDEETFTQALNRIVQSLSQHKSWEVEYKEENGVYKVLKIN